MREFLAEIWTWTALILGSGLGVGYIPWLSGTVGSLWGLPLVWLLLRHKWPLWNVSLLWAALFLVGVPICGRAAKFLDREDPSQVVFDEIAAFPIVFAPLLFLAGPWNFTTATVGFLWFRLFDMLKPWPISRFELLPEGWGIMADDAAAALYAAAAFWLTLLVFGIGGMEQV